MEVIEHLDPSRLAAFERVVFEHAQAGRCRRDDAERRVQRDVRVVARRASSAIAITASSGAATKFATWADAVAQRHGYAVSFEGIGPADPELGSPTQMAVFTR